MIPAACSTRLTDRGVQVAMVAEMAEMRRTLSLMAPNKERLEALVHELQLQNKVTAAVWVRLPANPCCSCSKASCNASTD